MTLIEAKQKLLNTAIKEINYHEIGNNYTKYAEGNWDNNFYGWKLQGQPWCDVFVDWCFSETFGIQKAKEMTYQTKGGSAACRYSAEYYQQNGAYYNYPEVGDQIFFYSGGAINHTGIVETVAGQGQAWTNITTIEGNTSDQVARRNYTRGNNTIAGFGRPKWSLVVNEDTQPQEQLQQQQQQQQQTPVIKVPSFIKKYHSYTYNVKINLLKEGDQGPQVQSMQVLLNSKGFSCNTDGIFTSETKEALKKFQIKAKIDSDGEFGGQGFNALWNYLEV